MKFQGGREHKCREMARVLAAVDSADGPPPIGVIDRIVRRDGVWWAVSRGTPLEHATAIRYCPWCAEALSTSMDDWALRVDPSRWSDALQRYLDVPAVALWVMACLAHEVDSSVSHDTMTPEVAAWLYRAEALVTGLVGVDSWDEAARILLIPARAPASLAAWLDHEGDAVPPRLRRALTEAPREGTDRE